VALSKRRVEALRGELRARYSEAEIEAAIAEVDRLEGENHELTGDILRLMAK
jgi:hypothetical protein